MEHTTQKLARRKCRPCQGDQEALGKEDITRYLNDLPEWALTAEQPVLFRDFKLKNFTACVDLINKIAEMAEAEGHHPDLHLTNYKHLRVELTTHAISGLSENDFIMAAKITEIA